MKILFFVAIMASLLTQCRTYTPNQKKAFELDNVKYSSSTMGSKGWQKPFETTHVKKFYTESNNDTLYEAFYDSAKNIIETKTTKYIKVKANELKLFKEPKTLHGFSFLGIYTEPVDIPGLYIVAYGKAGKGLFRKFCYAPGSVFIYDYSSINPANPFKNDSLPQSNSHKVEINGTIRLQQKN